MLASQAHDSAGLPEAVDHFEGKRTFYGPALDCSTSVAALAVVFNQFYLKWKKKTRMCLVYQPTNNLNPYVKGTKRLFIIFIVI